VREHSEERLERFGVGGDAGLAVDERVDALLAARQLAGISMRPRLASWASESMSAVTRPDLLPK